MITPIAPLANMMGRDTGEPGYDSASNYIIEKIKEFYVYQTNASGLEKSPSYTMDV